MDKETNSIIMDVCELDAQLNLLVKRMPDIKVEDVGMFYGEMSYLATKCNAQIQKLNACGLYDDASAIYLCYKSMHNNYLRKEKEFGEFIEHNAEIQKLLGK